MITAFPVVYLAQDGNTLNAGGGIALMRNARSRRGAELQARGGGGELRRTTSNMTGSTNSRTSMLDLCVGGQFAHRVRLSLIPLPFQNDVNGVAPSASDIMGVGVSSRRVRSTPCRA